MNAHFPLEKKIIDWLLEGDVSIQYQVQRDLLGQKRPDLQERIATEGWGKRFLDARKPEGHWGNAYYNPKWISSHYSLLDLKNLNISPRNPLIRESLMQILKTKKGLDGGINPAVTVPNSDVCLAGMVLNMACYFKIPESELGSMIDFLIKEQMADGGFNCNSNYIGAVHSSLHTTISVLEGFEEYKRNGYTYQLDKLLEIEPQCHEFILMHRLYRSDHTGEIINKKFLMLSYPSRWFYDILRALDYFQNARVPWDERMRDAVEILLKKQRKDGTWPVQAKHAGQVHFDMEQTGQPSRWNTLRALRVLKFYGENL